MSNLNGFQSALIVTVNATTGYFTTTSAFPITLLYNNSLIAQNVNVSVSAFCNVPCKQCQSTNQSSCISCLPTPYTALIYLVSSTQTCASECPGATYLSSSTCLSCSTTCGNCSTISTNCTSCRSGTYFYNNTCPGSCPNGTYPSSNQC